jgi:uncharacterized protein (TIGR03067 family)
MKISNGLWTIAHAEMNGYDITDSFSEERLEIAESGYKVWKRNSITDEGALCYLDNDKSLDMVGAKGPNQGKLFKCIYKFNNESLTICCNINQRGHRPTDFKATSENGFVLVDY